MPKIFSKKKSGLNDNDPQHDDSMTIISSASMGGSSVSDRIMGRMKINLGSSFASNDSGGGKRRSLSRSQSTGRRRFNSSAPNLDDPFGLDDTSTVSGGTGGGKSKRGSLLKRSQSARRFRSSDKSLSGSKKGGGVSSVGVPSMEDMDSSESMALKGQSMGRRRSSRSVTSGGGGSNRRLGGSNRSLGSSDINTVEYTLAQLRAMNEDELQRVMLKTGVSQEDINKTIQDASKKEGKDIEKGLVTLFVNSGYVKLVAKPTTSVDSPPSNTATSSTNFGSSSERTLDMKPPAKDTSKDEDKMARKTKLDKIAELKTANSLMKRENKSLKKTVKKLLGQLTDAVKEKSELQSKLDETVAAAAKEEVDDGETDTEDKAVSSALDIETNETLRKSTLSAIDETNTKYDTKSSQGSSSQQDDGGIIPAYVVPHNTTTSSSRRTSDLDESIDDSLRSENQTTTASSKQSISSDASNTITYLKRKLKKLKSSSENTEFRLKAEIDILTKEVDGLQRELGLTLKSLDSSKKRASNLKVELRTVSSKVNDLTREAEARDQLIDTFSGILLQKVGLESLTANDVTAEEEKDRA